MQVLLFSVRSVSCAASCTACSDVASSAASAAGHGVREGREQGPGLDFFLVAYGSGRKSNICHEGNLVKADAFAKLVTDFWSVLDHMSNIESAGLYTRRTKPKPAGLLCSTWLASCAGWLLFTLSCMIRISYHARKSRTGSEILSLAKTE